MRRTHCWKCWQEKPLLSRRCLRCGEVGRLQFGKDVAACLLYVGAGAAMIGMVAWIAGSLFWRHS